MLEFWPLGRHGPVPCLLELPLDFAIIAFAQTVPGNRGIHTRSNWLRWNWYSLYLIIAKMTFAQMVNRCNSQSLKCAVAENGSLKWRSLKCHSLRCRRTVVELPRERVSSTPSPRHVPRAVAGTGGYRYRSNTKFIEWRHRTKTTARESVNPFQRYKLLKSVMGSDRVGSGRVGPRILRFLP